MQAVGFLFDDGITFATELFEQRPVEHRDLSAVVLDNTEVLQLASGLGHTLAAYPKHVGDQLLGHNQAIARQPVQRQQQSAAQLLVDRVVAVTNRRLGHLRNQCLGITQHQHTHIGITIELGP